MNLPELQYQFYGAQVKDISLGPRQEVTLILELWPQTDGRLHNTFRTGEGVTISIRFGGLHHFEEVNSFWERWQVSTNHLSLHDLRYSRSKDSKPGKLFFEITFDDTDACLAFQCRNITITCLPKPST